MPGAKLLWLVGLLTAGLTAFYMFRLWFLTFFGESRAVAPQPHTPEPTHHAEASKGLAETAHAAPHAAAGHGHDGHHGGEPHESPGVMLGPLVILAFLAVFGGALGWPAALGGSNFFGHFLAPVTQVAGAAEPTENKGLELGLALVSVLTAFAGIGVAYIFYVARPALPGELATRFRGAYALLLDKYRVDELYSAIFVAPLLLFSRYILMGFVDSGVITGAASGIGLATQGLGSIARQMQSGNIRTYAGWLAFGAGGLLLLAFFGFGTHAGLR
jgi:NADH-quinone oxidoreductase subunit L